MAQQGAGAVVVCLGDARPGVAAAAARACGVAARQHEPAKVSLAGAGALAALLRVLSSAAAAQPGGSGGCGWAAAALCVEPCAQALCRLATPDDPRSSASCAFAHGRAVHSQGGSAALLRLLQQRGGGAGGARFPPAGPAAAALLSALRCACVNDEACASAADAGAVECAVASLEAAATGGGGGGAAGGFRPARGAALSLLRALAGCDAAKPRVTAGPGLGAVVGVLVGACGAPHAPGAARAAEQCLALLAALALRNADGACALAAAGALGRGVDAMRAFPGAAPVQRAACMLLRNAVARCDHLRGPLLEGGAEALLRRAKRDCPGACADVGSAALRDLGAADYAAGWTPTTVYVGDQGQLYTYEELDGADGGGRPEEAQLPAVREDDGGAEGCG